MQSPPPFYVQTLTKRVKVRLVRRTSTGPLYARFWFKGTQYFESTKKHNDQLAKVAVKDFIRSIEDAKGEDLAAAVAVQQCLADRWPTAEAQDASGHYITTKRLLERFAEHVGGRSLAPVDFDDAVETVQTFLTRTRKRPPSPQTLICEQRIISRFYAWLLQKRKIHYKANPASKKFLTLPAVYRQPKPPVSERDLKILLKHAKRTSVWPALVLILSSGLRPRGTMRVDVTDINFKEKRLKVFEKRRWRYVPLNAWALAELRRYVKTHPKDKLISVGIDVLHWHIQKIRKRYKLSPEVTLNGCRRTFISMCMKAGVPAEMVASIAGNSIAVIERHYMDLSTMDAQDAVAKVDLGALLKKKGAFLGARKPAQ